MQAVLSAHSDGKPRPVKNKCIISNCENQHHARGYCQTHYFRLKQYGRPDLLPRNSLEDRFWSRVNKSSDCWDWNGVISRAGYGVWTWKDNGILKSDSAHHFAYIISGREIPCGYHLDHLCRNRKCCNPNHLEPVTPRENTLRGIGPSAENARKTHCKRGHEFTPGNTRIKQGRYGLLRVCRKCQADAARERRAKCHR